MKISITYWWLFACLYASFSGKAQTASYAAGTDSLMRACMALEKSVFASRNDTARNLLLVQKALCQKKMRAYRAEEKTLLRIDLLSCGDSLACVVYYERALCQYMLAKFKEASDGLERAYSLPVNTPESRGCLLLHGFVLNELNQYDLAKKKLGEFLALTEPPAATRAAALIDSIIQARQYSQAQIAEKSPSPVDVAARLGPVLCAATPESG